jgi:two-component system response regulator FixJ
LVLIEPDVSVRDALTVLLESEGWEVSSLSDCTRLAREIEDTRVLAVISEAHIPDCAPQDIHAQCANHDVPVIFTGHDLPLQGAVDLIRLGAMDFLDKPFPQSRLLDLLEGLGGRQNERSRKT